MSFLNGTDPGLRQTRTPTVDTFAAGVGFTAGSSTYVTLSVDCGTEASLITTFDGVTQHRDTYSYDTSNRRVTFDAAIPTGVAKIECTYTTTIPATTPADGSVTEAKLGGASVTQTKLGSEVVNEAKLQVSNAPTNGYFLSAQSGNTGGLTWAEAGGGALVHLSSQTASSSSTINFTQISSTYNTYRFVFENVLPGTNNPSFAIRTSTDGGSSYDSGSSDYFRTGFWENGASVTNNTGTVAYGYFVSAGVNSDASNGGVSGSLELYNPLGTSYTMWVSSTVASDGSNDPTAQFFCGHRQSAADVDAVQFLFDSGVIASGTIRMYGYVKS